MKEGRRIALLLTGVLPLLAKYDVPASDMTASMEEDENDLISIEGAAEKLHNDVLTSIPGLPFELTDLTYAPSSDIIGAQNDYKFDGMFEDELGFLSWNSSMCLIENSNSSLPSEIADVELPDIEVVEIITAEREEGQSLETDKEDPQSVNKTQIVQVDEEDDSGADRLLVDYASKSAGAQLLEKAPSMKGASNLLTNDNDKYAITPCTDKKYVVVGLSEDILVKQIKIANYERYSSHVKDFQVLGSQTMGEWVDLGIYTAKIGNGEQSFDLEEPAWARYLKFRFLTHYRDEHYCTLSQLKVHGSTMLQGFHEQWTGEETDVHDNDESNMHEDSSNPATEGNKQVQEAESKIPEASQDELTSQSENAAVAENEVAPTEKAYTDDQMERNEPQHEVKMVQEISSKATSLADIQDKLVTLRPLPEIFDIYASGMPYVLESTRFERPSLRSINEVYQQKTELLNTASILFESNPVKSPKREMREGSENVTGDSAEEWKVISPVTDAVQKLQIHIQSTIGKTRELKHTIETMIGRTLPRLAFPSSALDKEMDAIISDVEKNQTSKPESPLAVQPVKKVDAATEPPKKVDTAPTSADQDSGGQEPQPVSPVVDESTLDMEVSVGLTKVFEKYPSAKCLESMHLPTFKKNIMDKMKAAAGPTGSPPGKMEPIFKTLTDQIKALQISQNVHDQFSRALITCYQDIMIEMANDVQDTQIRQEDRLLKVEAQLKQMKSKDWVSQISAGFVLILSFGLSVSVLILQLSDEVVRQVLKLEHGPLLVGAGLFVVAIAIGISFLSTRRHRSSKRSIRVPSTNRSQSGDSDCEPKRRFSLDTTAASGVANKNSISRTRSLQQIFPSE